MTDGGADELQSTAHPVTVDALLLMGVGKDCRGLCLQLVCQLVPEGADARHHLSICV
eukprot:CAMPEP_0181197810 /NCGR_PEP_ID=MMETSP1096-20121128/16250_1 /TAXON_ID=156174 ORGANISM="Chrysochromulina ericina, Strain CCMP281" /NCGR_SAMPLE_ID=MMETSP1096 /ASSEMBLY_ACC=CAM_ASM_000453 /LENGTH=56 /DNA_ID=CAMNT_0023287767 /DNA_START=1039 /DNA_END=1210 /DNA_ORIENTATION=-